MKNAKIATSIQGEYLKQTARTHFIGSLPPDLMKESSEHAFQNDEDKLQHLKRCIQFLKIDPSTLKAKLVVTMVLTNINYAKDEEYELVAALEEPVWSIIEQLQELRSNASDIPKVLASRTLFQCKLHFQGTCFRLFFWKFSTSISKAHVSMWHLQWNRTQCYGLFLATPHDQMSTRMEASAIARLRERLQKS